ncbi:lodestar [Carabus blaptoides fortunei]
MSCIYVRRSDNHAYGSPPCVTRISLCVITLNMDNANYDVPRTFGHKGSKTCTTEKDLTMDTLQNLHNSLATCPAENTLVDDPKGLTVKLMPHQKRALAWLIWRESQKPSGGILADDMGLGKTLTMISLIIKTKEMDSGCEPKKTWDGWFRKGINPIIPGGTVVLCPATLLHQWNDEVEKYCTRNLLSVKMHHGPVRECNFVRLAEYDIVITTYQVAMREYDRKGPLFSYKMEANHPG